MKKRVFIILLALVMAFGLIGCDKGTKPPTDGDKEPQATKALKIYMAGSTIQAELIEEMFNAKYPDVKIEMVSAGTGELAARVAAESANPQADLMIGGSYAAYAGIQEHLADYVSPNAKDCFEAFVSKNKRFTAIQINVNTMIVNNARAKSLGVEIKGWASLLDPKLKGEIAYADPTASSSALEQLVNMLTAKTTTDSPEGGWDFIKDFAKNLDSKISSSSSNVYRTVVAGEYTVGLTNEEKVIENIMDGADVSAVYAEEGITLRTTYCGVIKGAVNEYNARLMVDFLTSKEYQEAAADKLYQRSVRKDVAFKVEGVAATDKLPSLEYPTEWVDANSGEIKTKWQDLLTSL